MFEQAIPANLCCKPFPGEISVQNIPHGPVYPAGFVGYITLDPRSCRMNSQPVLKFPIPALDAHGQSLLAGSTVRVVAVTSCAAGLPHEDQARLQAIVGQTRRIVRFDGSGFVWLSFAADERSDDFCLFPNEVALA